MLTGRRDYQAVPAPPPSLRYFHAIFWGSAAALIVAGCVFLEKNNAFVPRLLLLPGDASYSIYLFHLLVLGLIAAFYLRVGFFVNPDLAIPIHATIAVGGSLLFYKWVERPLLRWLRKYDLPIAAPPRTTPPRSAKP